MPPRTGRPTFDRSKKPKISLGSCSAPVALDYYILQKRPLGLSRQCNSRRSAALKAIAVIPARGGSKGLPRKNLLPLCGKPLVAWTIESALAAQNVERVVVSTDDPQIAQVSRAYGAEVVQRPPEISGDASPSEEALLHALEALNIDRGPLAFLQCTAPLTLPQDIDGTLALLASADTAFTATPWHRFLWKATPAGAEPIGHSKDVRLMRQQLEPHYLEVGAVYAMRAEGLLRTRRRFHGATAIYQLPPERSLEIDDETDWVLVEALMRRRLQMQKEQALPVNVAALIMDFDGVLTDNRVAVDQTGVESVTCHRGDGWAISRLRQAGLRMLVLTGESSPVVARRCEKLGVEWITAHHDKLPVLKAWLDRHGIAPAQAVYVGNDLPDCPCMLYVGCGIAPADAHPSAKAAARVVLETAGGHGCIRELADLIMSPRRESLGTPADHR